MGAPRDLPGLRKGSEKKFAPRFFSGIESRARASAGARFSCLSSGIGMTFGFRALDGSLGFLLGALGGSLGLTSGALGCSSVSLGALLVSFWVLLRPSSPPIRCSGVFQNDLQTTFASQTSMSRKGYYSQRIIVNC